MNQFVSVQKENKQVPLPGAVQIEDSSSEKRGGVPAHRTHSKSVSPSARRTAYETETRGQLKFKIKGNSPNQLINVASGLLGLAIQAREIDEFEGQEILYKQICDEINNIENELYELGYERPIILAHRYCLCTVIDEAVMSTKWSEDSDWAERSMLSVFHNETWGGEKFYTVLDRVLKEPLKFQDLLEFIYVCIGIGFEGKYHVMYDGKRKLNRLLQQVYKIIEEQRGDPLVRLTDPEANVIDKKPSLEFRVSWPMFFTSLLALLFVIHLIFSLNINPQIDTVIDAVKIQDSQLSPELIDDSNGYASEL